MNPIPERLGATVDDRVAGVAVVTDAGGGHERVRPLRSSLDRRGEGARRLDPARADRLLSAGRPAPAADRRSREVDDGGGPVDLGADVVPAARASLPPAAGAARDDDDVVALDEQRPDERAPDQARAACDDDLHRPVLSAGGRLDRCGPCEISASAGSPRSTFDVAGSGQREVTTFAARVEVDPLGPVDVPVAEERALPAAERVVGDRHRDRHVDADHARLDVELELAGDAAVAREDRRAVAVRVLVDEPDRLVVGVDARDAEHRAEDLVAVVVHLRRDVVDQRRPEEEAVAVGRALAAVDDDRRALAAARARRTRRPCRGARA